MKNTKVLVVNGPNISRLGVREPDIYGHTTYQELID
ncbi:MAG: Dehydroquinase class, partial [Actinomycetota bacterium]